MPPIGVEVDVYGVAGLLGLHLICLFFAVIGYVTVVGSTLRGCSDVTYRDWFDANFLRAMVVLWLVCTWLVWAFLATEAAYLSPEPVSPLSYFPIKWVAR